MRSAIILILAGVALPAAAERVTLPLGGTWEIEESVGPDDLPRQFHHKAPVPGLAHLAIPAFPDVDRFDSRESIMNHVRRGLLPESAKTESAGVSRQERNYFWYRRTFRVPARKQTATLKINKAQFGASVWLNGRKIGEHLPCFSAAFFDVTEALNGEGDNTLVIRVGAHPGVLPLSVVAGTDFEKLKWTPGIYDDVSLLLADNPVIETVQVAPRIQTSEILVQVALRNRGAAGRFRIGHQVAGVDVSDEVVLGAGETRTVARTLRIPEAHLWSPEDPFLYTLATSTSGDRAVIRFGMREFRFDTPTRRAYLNGKPYFLRGSNITLHRFFEDPKSGALPWDETWVRKLLAQIPKQMHWNSFRFCIGPVPDRWLDIADEAGLLIQNEYFVWTGREGFHREWTADALIGQYSEWVRDNWNHPSVVLWDAANETTASVLGDTVIPTVRKLDLSNRPWDNGYGLPAGPDDPIEDHPYLFSALRSNDRGFQMADLERMTGPKSTNSPHPSSHAVILNEYGWLWLNRDGTPTALTDRVYEKLLGPAATPRQRLDLNAYLLAGLTEYWRAHRNFAGVLHFVYLTACFPGAYTCDHWRDVETLDLDPQFADYVGQAFQPLGVYINFWQETVEPGATRHFPVVLVNDESRAQEGLLTLSIESAAGETVASTERPFSLASLGQSTLLIDLPLPKVEGRYLLRAVAGGTLCRRKLTIASMAERK